MNPAASAPGATVAAVTPPAPGSTPAPADTAAPPAAAPTGFAERIKREQEKREVAKLQARLAELEPKAKQADELTAWRAAVKSDPSKLKELYGDDYYDLLTEHKIGGGKLTPELLDAKVDERFKSLEAQRAAEAAKSAADRKAEEDAVTAEWREGVIDTVKSKAADFRLVNLHGQHAAVADWIDKNYAATGKLATPEEGAKAVEASLRKAVLDSLDADLVGEWTKTRQQVSPPTSASREVRTLHNGMASTTPAAADAPRNRAERKAAVLAKLEAMEAAGKTG